MRLDEIRPNVWDATVEGWKTCSKTSSSRRGHRVQLAQGREHEALERELFEKYIFKDIILHPTFQSWKQRLTICGIGTRLLWR